MIFQARHVSGLRGDSIDEERPNKCPECGEWGDSPRQPGCPLFSPLDDEMVFPDIDNNYDPMDFED